MTRPPYRADEVGSLLRPQELKEARAAHEEGRIDADELRAVEDRLIRDVVARQEAVGLKAVTDGEFGDPGGISTFWPGWTGSNGCAAASPSSFTASRPSRKASPSPAKSDSATTRC